MSSAWASRAAALTLLAFTGGLLTQPASAAAPGMRFCIDRASPLAGRDAKVARAVAAAAGSAATLVPFSSARAGKKGVRGPLLRKLATRCDVVMGVPLPAPGTGVPKGLTLAAAYAKTGYVLVTVGTAPAPLAALPRGFRLGVTYLAPSSLFAARHPALAADIFDSDAQSLAALAAGKVAGAVVWQPDYLAFLARHRALAAFARAHGLRFRTRLLHQPHAAWVIAALTADDAAGHAAGERFAAGLAKLLALQEKAHLSGLIAPLALPRLAPAAPAVPALFTTAQAAAGGRVFAQNCAACHGGHLQGLVGPTLKGPGFASASMGYSVGAIFSFLAGQMPAGRPASLTPRQYADVMAFILAQNGYPAGPRRLGFAAASASTTPLVSRVP